MDQQGPAAALGCIDWRAAGLVRAAEHIRMVNRPSLDPLAVELLEVTKRLVSLQRLTEAIYLEERERGIGQGWAFHLAGES